MSLQSHVASFSTFFSRFPWTRRASNMAANWSENGSDSGQESNPQIIQHDDFCAWAETTFPVSLCPPVHLLLRVPHIDHVPSPSPPLPSLPPPAVPSGWRPPLPSPGVFPFCSFVCYSCSGAVEIIYLSPYLFVFFLIGGSGWLAAYCPVVSCRLWLCAAV